MPPAFLVTGASGFVGSAIAARLAEQGMVTGLARTPPARPELAFIRHDVANPFPDLPELSSAIVVHCAAEIRSQDPQLLWRSNVLGMRNLLAWCARHQVRRLVLLSTGGVYGYVKGRRMQESDPARPAGPYAETKYAAEDEARQWSERCGLELVTFRLYFPFSRSPGPGVFRLVEDAIRHGAPLQIKRDGAPRMTPVHLVDAVHAVARAVTPDFPPGCYNLCGDDDISFLELVRGKERRLGVKARLALTDELGGDMMGSNAALRHTGWRPTVGLNNIIDLAE
jgi:nucleoside-diphosphate-sugar epimerase